MANKEFPNATDYAGIDYGMGLSNKNHETGFRFGVISQHDILQAWADSSEPVYPDPECACGKAIDEDELPYTCECGEELAEWYLDGVEALGYVLDDGEYKAETCFDTDVMVLESPYYTYAQFCSPCVPGGCSLNSPLDADHMFTENRCYCFGHDWFDEGKAPYPVYRVSDNKRVLPPDCPFCDGKTEDGYCRACNYPAHLGHI